MEKYLRSKPVHVLPELKPQFNLILTKTIKYALKRVEGTHFANLQAPYMHDLLGPRSVQATCYM